MAPSIQEAVFSVLQAEAAIFAASRQLSVTDQLNQAKALLSSKWTPEPDKPSLIAYFQAYTNTYGDPDRLLSCYEEALSSPEVAGISIATRPDCLSDIILEGLDRLRLRYPDRFIWIELGLQSIHDHTAARIRRGIQPPYFMMLQQSSMPKGFPLLSI